ncbi:MAG: hypothetical protein IT359_20655 [Gemmatimonadaceae bacterium]|nr:hypothetical protein [Gemmatimonadaceae bacterium]
MRSRFLLLAMVLGAPVALGAQAAPPARRGKDVETFEVAKLPPRPASEIEKEIFALLRTHRKGDLTDASRIHLKLAQYYKERGEELLEDVCNQKATEAWAAASGERPSSAGSQGSPPFDPEGAFSGLFTYVDDLKVEHTWEFFADGTFAHAVASAEQRQPIAPRELGWYTVKGSKMRLWQFKSRADRTVEFQLLEAGALGAVLDGVKLQAVR